MTTVHQCPYCELRFEFPYELEDHLKADHDREMHLPRTPREPPRDAD